jgi:hypothetical protein
MRQGYFPEFLESTDYDPKTAKVDFNPSSSKSAYQDLPEEERQQIQDLLFILERTLFSNSMLSLSNFCKLKFNCFTFSNSSENIAILCTLLSKAIRFLTINCFKKKFVYIAIKFVNCFYSMSSIIF